MKLKVKKLHPDARIHTPARPGDAGYDIECVEINSFSTYFKEYDTGLAITVPENHVGLLFPRSSVSNRGLSLANSVGVLDSKFTGEIKFRFYKKDNAIDYNIGDRIGQLVIVPFVSLGIEYVDELPKSERGSGSYGSTGT